MVRVLAGVFVGGLSSRMGGGAKGLLPAPSGEKTLIERWENVLAGLGVRAALVGDRGAYEGHSSLARVADADPSAGPLGGLVALLEAAGEGEGTVLALACDMPYVTAGLLSRLIEAPSCTAVAPRRDGRWEPLCARYDARASLPVARARLVRRALGLQGLLDELGARALPVTEAEARELDDWDTPEDRGAR